VCFAFEYLDHGAMIVTGHVRCARTNVPWCPPTVLQHFCFVALARRLNASRRRIEPLGKIGLLT